MAESNDYQLKIVRIEGDFIWHHHPETDAAFLVLEGELRIDFRDEHVVVKAGEMFVVPRGTRAQAFRPARSQAITRCLAWTRL